MKTVEHIAEDILRLFIREGYKPGEPLMERVITLRYARKLRHEEQQNITFAIHLLVEQGYIEPSNKIENCYILTNKGYCRLQRLH